MVPGCGPADHPGAAAGQEGVDHGVERWVRSNTEPHRREETPCSSSPTTPTVDSLRDYINGSLEPASTQTYSPINEDRAVLPERQLS